MKFRWWMPPVFVIGTAAVANVILISTAVRVRPTKVAAHPYAASAHEDDRRQEMAGFSSRGWRLHSVLDDGGATLRLEAATGPKPAIATIDLYRPDDDRLDRSLAWADPTSALRVPLPRPGVWELRLTVHDQGGTVLTHQERVMRP
jgi:nitrogen fixation protein FixH